MTNKELESRIVGLEQSLNHFEDFILASFAKYKVGDIIKYKYSHFGRDTEKPIFFENCIKRVGVIKRLELLDRKFYYVVYLNEREYYVKPENVIKKCRC